MKKLTLLFVFLISLYAISNTYSQGIPETINYQGVLKDAAGVVVPNGDYNLTFKLYDLPSGGSVLWNETKTINVVGGIINTQLGSVTPIPQTVFNTALWLGIAVASGTELTPRIALTSVPYSIYSLNVPDGTITADKIAGNEVVKSLNGLKDNINLVAGANVTITPAGNNLTISSTGSGSGIGGSGTTNYLPLFTNSTTLGNSLVYQSAGNDIGIGTTSPTEKLDVYGDIELGATTPIKLKSKIGSTGWWGLTLNIDGNEYYSFDRLGTAYFSEKLGIGITQPVYPLHVSTNRQTAGYFTSDTLSLQAKVIVGEYLGAGQYDAVGVYGKSTPINGYGIGGKFEGGYMGILGTCYAGDYTGFASGVYGISDGISGNRIGVYGEASGNGAGFRYGVYGSAAGGTTNYAGYFLGNVNVTGTLSKGGGSFKIDHPLDPTNKNLYHSFVESPDMKNIYDGNVVTDGSGYATITMPDWFEALNQEFRYQLTVIGDFAQAIVAQEIQNNQFAIRTDKANIKVSWQVTGIRHDKFAEKYRIPVEEDKTGKDVGKYLHPDAYGVSETMGVDYENNKAARDKK